MRTKPACAAALAAVAILMAATAEVSAAPAPSVPIDAPGCHQGRLVHVDGPHGGHFVFYRSASSCIPGPQQQSWPFLTAQPHPQLVRGGAAVRMRSFGRPLGGGLVRR
jgi:hypothetical protein